MKQGGGLKVGSEGVESAPGRRDGLKQARRSRPPAQQELPLFIYINPADISIFPASSRMLNFNRGRLAEDLYPADGTVDLRT